MVNLPLSIYFYPSQNKIYVWRSTYLSRVYFYPSQNKISCWDIGDYHGLQEIYLETLDLRLAVCNRRREILMGIG